MVPSIGLACGIGGRVSGAEMGPLVLNERLNADLLWKAMAYPPSGSDSYERIAAANRDLAEAAYALAKTEPFLLSFGGDHSCAIGTWSGVSAAKEEAGDIGLLWIDAHMDSHTPETSETGNIHGMPLAALLGYGDNRLTRILHPRPKLKPENVALIGIRSFEEGEAKLLERLNVRIYFMEEVKARGLDEIIPEAIRHVSNQTVGYGVSFDLDSIDPTFAAAVGTPEPDGLDPAEMLAATAHFRDFPPIAFELVEYIPALDASLQSFRYIEQLIKAIVPATVPSARL